MKCGGAREAAALCRRHGVDIPQLALQFSVDHPDITTTIAGSANPANIRQWIRWLKEPIDRGLLEKVQTLFRHVKNVGHIEGLTVNN